MSLKEKAESAKEVLEGDKGLNKTYSSQKEYPDETAAKDAFNDAKNRMFNVNTWGKIPGPENATFLLYDRRGYPYKKEVIEDIKPRVGDFIKTLLPGNLPEDWVRVVDVQEDTDHASFTVRPSKDPTDEDQPENVTEHFFQSTATSTFNVERKDNILIASETGLGEQINNEDPEAGKRNKLNTAISEAGWAFVQKLQWENVTDYIVGKKGLKEE